MVLAPCTVLGSLPVVADVSFTRDYYGECDADVNELYWQVKGSWENPLRHGKPLSQKVMDRIEKEDYWQSSVIEQVSDWIAYNEEKDDA